MKQIETNTENEISPQECHLIDSTQELEQICAKITTAGRVAVDTEFVWERTYYPNLGIVQLALNENEAWLLDMPALAGKLKSLAEVLANPEIEKILHDAKQDLTILRIATGSYPKNIFDTRLAAGFVGPSATLSLLDSCSLFANLTLNKGETRSNWLKRPLTASQCKYALDDVLFLPQIRDEIMAQAKKLGREAWLKEEMKLYDNPEIYDDPAPEHVYSKVKGAGRLSRKELAILLRLAAWREQEARHRNRPRRHIIADEPLIEMALNQPLEIEQLQKNCRLSPRASQRYGKKLLAEIKLGQQITEAECPEPLRRSRNPKTTELIRKVLTLIADIGATENLDPTLIATRKEVEHFLVNAKQSKTKEIPLRQGWRLQIAGEKILSHI